MLLQIQRNAFLLNWRKRDKQYPHFDQVKAEFDRHLDAFQVFLKAEFGIDHLPIQITELTYTNLVQEGDVWTGATDVAKIIPGFSVPDLGMPMLNKPDINYVASYKLSSDLTLNFTARTAHQAMDASKTALIFEFRAFGIPGTPDRAGADSWYHRAHDTIGECFTAVTSSDIRQTVWQPE